MDSNRSRYGKSLALKRREAAGTILGALGCVPIPVRVALLLQWPKMKIVRAGMGRLMGSLMCAAALSSPVAQAAEPAPLLLEVRFGALGHDLNFGGERREDGIDFNLELVFNPRRLLGLEPVAVRHWFLFAGLTGQAAGDVSDQIYAGAGYDFFPRGPALLRFGAGLALHDGELVTADDSRLALGQRWLFYAALEAGWRFLHGHSLSLLYQHSSNGLMDGPNHGIDNVGLRYGLALGR